MPRYEMNIYTKNNIFSIFPNTPFYFFNFDRIISEQEDIDASKHQEIGKGCFGQQKIIEKLQQHLTQFMEALKSTKNHCSNKFIIKPKSSITHLKSENAEPETTLSCNEHEVNLFLNHMIEKSKKFKQLLSQKQITNEVEFFDNYLFKSVCLKTILKTVIDKMLNERRLGRNLKGLNKSNLAEIQGCIWKSLLREVDLYKNEKEFYRGKEQLQATLAKRKQEILQQLQKLKTKSKSIKPPFIGKENAFN